MFTMCREREAFLDRLERDMLVVTSRACRFANRIEGGAGRRISVRSQERWFREYTFMVRQDIGDGMKLLLRALDESR